MRSINIPSSPVVTPANGTPRELKGWRILTTGVPRRWLFLALAVSLLCNVAWTTIGVTYALNRGGLSYVLMRLGFIDARPRAGNNDLAEILALHTALPVQSNDIVFIGDSLTYAAPWNELLDNPRIRNRAIGGDKSADVLARLPGILQGKPSKIFLMIGTNDLGAGIPAQTVARNYRLILSLIRERSPTTRVYVQSVLPTYMPLNVKVPAGLSPIHLNNLLRRMAEEFGATYINLYPHFASEETGIQARYTTDRIHLTTAAYLLWRDRIRSYVDEP